MQAKNTRQIAKSFDLPEINSLSPINASENFLLSFLSYQAHTASCHQFCRYIRQSLITCSKVKKNVTNSTYNSFCLK